VCAGSSTNGCAARGARRRFQRGRRGLVKRPCRSARSSPARMRSSGSSSAGMMGALLTGPPIEWFWRRQEAAVGRHGRLAPAGIASVCAGSSDSWCHAPGCSQQRGGTMFRTAWSLRGSCYRPPTSCVGRVAERVTNTNSWQPWMSPAASRLTSASTASISLPSAWATSVIDQRSGASGPSVSRGRRDRRYRAPRHRAIRRATPNPDVAPMMVRVALGEAGYSP
jgi:hypothetical protein